MSGNSPPPAKPPGRIEPTRGSDSSSESGLWSASLDTKFEPAGEDGLWPRLPVRKRVRKRTAAEAASPPKVSYQRLLGIFAVGQLRTLLKVWLRRHPSPISMPATVRARSVPPL
jgi:hypothetical protein